MKVAVIGAGVSGLAASWYLNEFTDHEIHLLESDGRAGGHANAVPFSRPGREPVNVDTAFVVFNPATYPNFLRFVNRYPSLRAQAQETAMTFSVSRDRGAFEWAGNSPASVFCQPWRLLDPRMWRLVYDFFRFNTCAPRVLLSTEIGESREITIGEYLQQEGYSEVFRDDYLVPMTAAIWSTPPDTCALDFPARTLIRFMYNHHLLQIVGKPPWLTFAGGSKIYVEHILSLLPASHIHMSTPVSAIRTADSRVEITTPSGIEVYDHVILACHADIALQMLQKGGNATSEEAQILRNFEFTENEAVLHWDDQLMPKSPAAWSCWNYLTESQLGPDGQRNANAAKISVTFRMNELQHIPAEKYGPVFVTINPPFEPAPEKIISRWTYEHPLLGTEAVRAQAEMPLIQNKRGISFAGAWMKYGFHEDGFTAGLRAAASITGLESEKPSNLDGHLKGKGKEPFKIVERNRVLDYSLWLAAAFDLFERYGLRAVVGVVCGAILALLRMAALWLGMDLHGLQEELSVSTR